MGPLRRVSRPFHVFEVKADREHLVHEFEAMDLCKMKEKASAPESPRGGLVAPLAIPPIAETRILFKNFPLAP